MVIEMSTGIETLYMYTYSYLHFYTQLQKLSSIQM